MKTNSNNSSCTFQMWASENLRSQACHLSIRELGARGSGALRPALPYTVKFEATIA